MASIENNRQLRIQVKQAVQLKGPPHAYTNQSDPRGALFISNCNTFSANVNVTQRCGSELDVHNLHNLFTQIGYEGVDIVQDLSKEQLLESLDIFRDKSIHSGVDSLVAVFMSHGVDAESFSAHDGGKIAAREIYSKFSNVNCPALAGKPKVFIFQFCRGDEHQVESVEGFDLDSSDKSKESSEYPMRKVSDIYLCFSTVPGFVSYRHITYGSPYIEKLCLILMDYAKDLPIYDMLEKVNCYLESTPGMQVGEHRAIGCKKKFYFNPKGNQSEDNSSPSKDGQLAPLNEAGESSSSHLQPSSSTNQPYPSELSEMAGEMSEHLAGGSERGKDNTSSSSDIVRGNVFFLNNLKGCEGDVAKLDTVFSGLGYRRHVLHCYSKESLLFHIKRLKPCPRGAIVVFFFGYGYDDHIFMGTSNTQSVSFKAFCEMFNCVREKGNSTVVFTNTCFMEKGSSTVTHNSSLQDPVKDTGHFCVKINGKNEYGSLLTMAILQEIDKEPTQEFSTFAENLTDQIQKLEEKEKDQYYTDVRFYGVMRKIIFPQRLSSRSGEKRLATTETTTDPCGIKNLEQSLKKEKTEYLEKDMKRTIVDQAIEITALKRRVEEQSRRIQELEMLLKDPESMERRGHLTEAKQRTLK